MPISLSGLDVSFLKTNPLPKKRGRPPKKLDHSKKRSQLPAPHFMPDAAAYIAVNTKTPTLISSRSQQREFEKRTGHVQVGNDFAGQWVKENNARKAEWDRRAKGHTTQPEWV